MQELKEALQQHYLSRFIRCSACIDQRRRDVYEIKAYHHWCLMTVIVEEDEINTLACSP